MQGLEISMHYPLNAINNSSVAIIGLGSGGSLISSYLAKSGLGELILIDGDVFKDVISLGTYVHSKILEDIKR